MRLFNSILMCLVGAMLIAPSFTDANAEDASVANRSQTTSRGKIKFHMKTLANVAEVSVRRPRINRVRSTTVRSNVVLRDSLEQDVSLEELNIKPAIAKTIMRTSTTPRPISVDSLENDDIALVLTKPVVNRNPMAANRLNRFRTTTAVPTSVRRDSLEQDDDDAVVLALKSAAPGPEQTSSPIRGRFNRVNSVSRGSTEKNDVSLEDLIVVAKPVLNGALSAPLTRGRIQMKSSLDSISPSTLAPTTPVDSTEKVDISLEDLEKTTFDIPTTTMAVTEVETASTEEIGTTAMPTIPVSLQSDEQDDVFVTDRTTVAPEPTNDAIETTATVVQLTTQSDEQMDFERVEKLAVTQDGAQVLTDQVSNAVMTTLISQQSDEQDDWTVPVTTSTMAPDVTRSPVVSKGRGRFQSATPINQVPRNRVNRIRLNPVKSSMPRASDEQQTGIVKETQTTSRDASVSGNRFSRLRSTTVRVPVLRDSVEQNDVSLEDLIIVPTTRSPLMGSRFSRFRTTTAAPVGQEVVSPNSETLINRNRFSRVRSTTARVPVLVDSVEDDSFLLANDFSKIKAANVALQQITLNSPNKVMSTGTTSVNRGRGSRRRTTTTATPISRHSAEDLSLEDVLKELGKTGEQLSVQQPAIISVPVDMAVPLSEISRHSDERDDIVDVPVAPMAAVTLIVEDVHDVDVSDEAPRTTTLDPVSSESGEKDDLTLVLIDETAVPATGSLQMDILPDHEALHSMTFNPVSKESEELPLMQMTKRVRMIRKQNSQM